MPRWLECMVSRIWMTVLLLPMVALITACNHNPTVSEANTYLQVQATQAQYDTYSNQLTLLQKQLTQVSPEFREVTPDPPSGRVSELSSFLERNNCLRQDLSLPEKDQCYQITRVILIQTTQVLDEKDITLWGAKQTIQQLVKNMNRIIDLAPRQPTTTLKPP